MDNQGSIDATIKKSEIPVSFMQNDSTSSEMSNMSKQDPNTIRINNGAIPQNTNGDQPIQSSHHVPQQPVDFSIKTMHDQNSTNPTVITNTHQNVTQQDTTIMFDQMTPHIAPTKPTIQPLLETEKDDPSRVSLSMPMSDPNIKLIQDQSQNTSPLRAAITKVKLSDELNIFDWFKTNDIINQIAEKAKSSVDTVITVLDPGMKDYLYSGGSINIMTICDHNSIVVPIRDAFQSVFGRATVTAAKYSSPQIRDEYPIKLANGFDKAIIVAQERIKRLRLETDCVPQNQVVVVLQPTLVSIISDDVPGNINRIGLKLDENLLPRWFLTLCLVIEDPVLGATMNACSQFIPIDLETVAIARESKFPETFSDGHLGFARSIDDLMNSKLGLMSPPEDESDEKDSRWFKIWAGLDEVNIVQELALSLAHLYKRKWNDCVG